VVKIKIFVARFFTMLRAKKLIDVSQSYSKNKEGNFLETFVYGVEIDSNTLN